MSTYLDNLELFDSKIIARGRAYYKEKKVHLNEATPNNVTAVVFGESHYDVHLQFDSEHDLYSATCTCPEGGFCRHMVATLYQVSDLFAQSAQNGDTKEEGDKGAALIRSVEDIKNSVFRFNYKGLSKAMEIFISTLPKSSKEGRKNGVKALFATFLSKGKYPIDYDRLTPYVREIIKKADFTQEEAADLFYELLKDHMTSEAVWIIMTRDIESSIPFQKAAYRRLREGATIPYHLSSVVPVTTWAGVDPELLEELLNSDAFEITPEDMAKLIKTAESKKSLDTAIDLFHAAVRYFDGFILDPSVLTTLVSSEPHKRKLEGIFYEEFSISPAPEKYLLWRSVASDDDFLERFGGKLDEIESPTRDFILLCEGRGRVGDAYDSIETRDIPFPLIGYAVDHIEEDFVKEQILNYGKEEERDILRDLEKRGDDLRTLLRIYGKFGRPELEKLLSNPLVYELAEEDTSLRGKILIEAYNNGLLGILDTKVYRD